MTADTSWTQHVEPEQASIRRVTHGKQPEPDLPQLTDVAC